MMETSMSHTTLLGRLVLGCQREGIVDRHTGGLYGFLSRDFGDHSLDVSMSDKSYIEGPPVVVVRLLIDTQNRLVDLYSALV